MDSAKLGLGSKIIIAVVVIIVIIWIFRTLIRTKYIPDGVFKDSYENMILSAHRQYDKFIESPINLYNQTVGYENNEIAQTALKKSIKREKLHSYNESKHKLSSKNVNDAVVSAYIAGNILRYNVGSNNNNEVMIDAKYYYDKALKRINDRTDDAINDTGNVPRPERIIENIEDFYIENNVPVDMNNIRLNLRRARVKAAAATQKRNNKTNKTNKANENITTEQQNNYFAEKNIRSDPQNVHDTSVVSESRNKLEAIIAKNADEYGSSRNSNDVKSAVENYKWKDAQSKKLALNALESMMLGNTISSLEAKDYDVLNAVWDRINSKQNMATRNNLIESFMDALVDSSQLSGGKHSLVCLMGRCTRLLDSLTLLDVDENLSAPLKTTEILRNEVFSKAHKIMQDTMKTADKSVLEAYNSLNPPPDMIKSVELLENKIKQNMNSIKKDYTDIPEHIINNLIEDAKAGV